MIDFCLGGRYRFLHNNKSRGKGREAKIQKVHVLYYGIILHFHVQCGLGYISRKYMFFRKLVRFDERL